MKNTDKQTITSNDVGAVPSGMIIEGIGSAVGRRSAGTALSQAMQDAMVQAIKDCMAEGITDPEVIRARQLAAKDAVKQQAQ